MVYFDSWLHQALKTGQGEEDVLGTDPSLGSVPAEEEIMSVVIVKRSIGRWSWILDRSFSSGPQTIEMRYCPVPGGVLNW